MAEQINLVVLVSADANQVSYVGDVSLLIIMCYDVNTLR